MYDNQKFDELIKAGKPTGEVAAIKSLLIQVRGLEGASVNGLVLFETGQRALVKAIHDDLVEVLALSGDHIPLGTLAVLEQATYQTGVGEALIGRVINVLGEPLDGKGPITIGAYADVFTEAPGIIEREALNEQLVTGVTIVDSLFPVVLGQRIALLGDSKSGKSTFLRQVTRYQAEAGRVIIYALITKRQIDIDALLNELDQTGAINQSIVVVASSFDALSHSYLAPYVAATIAEQMWKSGQDVIVIYDDLSNHAKVYREISLLAEVSPGRDSYPGDMFYAHSSLLERAGKLAEGGGTLTALPVINTPGDDITAFLPTSLMSITDGQLIFDLENFRQGIRPAVNVGLSVSRVGGRVQDPHWKELSGLLFKKLADYRQASEFAQFGSELAPQARADLALGRMVYDVFKQTPGELYSLNTQFLMLAVALAAAGRVSLNIGALKEQAHQKGAAFDPNNPTALIKSLLQASTVQVAS